MTIREELAEIRQLIESPAEGQSLTDRERLAALEVWAEGITGRLDVLEKDTEQIWYRMILDRFGDIHEQIGEIRREMGSLGGSLGDEPAEPGPALGEPVGGQERKGAFHRVAARLGFIG